MKTEQKDTIVCIFLFLLLKRQIDLKMLIKLHFYNSLAGQWVWLMK